MTAPSSQLSQRRRTTSTASAASRKSSSPSGADRRAEQRRLVCRRAHPHLPAGPAVRNMVKRRNRFRDMERLGVGDRRDGDESDVCGDRRDARGHERGVGAPRQAPRRDLGPAARLRIQAVVDGQEVQQATFGGGGQRGPVSPAELPAAGCVVREGVSPRVGVPPVAVEPHGQMQLGHDRAAESAVGTPSCIVSITHCATLSAAMHSGAELTSA